MIRYWFPLGILAIWTVAAITGGWVVDSANQIDLQRILMRPGDLGLMGYDDLGRPILQRIWVGAQVSLLVSFGVVSLSLLIGTAVGLIAGYQGGWLDLILVRVMDVFLAFPGILLAIALAGIMGPGVDNLIIALSAVGWVGFARLTRGQVLSLKQRDHVTAAIALGTPRHLILLRHLLPLLSAPLIVEATFGMAGMVIAEAGLSFLGIGYSATRCFLGESDQRWGQLYVDGTPYGTGARGGDYAGGIVPQYAR